MKSMMYLGCLTKLFYVVGEVSVHENHERSLAQLDAVLVGGAEAKLARPFKNALP